MDIHQTGGGKRAMAVRTQIYLPEALHHRLKSRGRILNKSMADQVREAVKRYLDLEEAPRPIPDDPVWDLPDHAIEGPPGWPTDMAARHDFYLYGWSKQKATRTRRKVAGRSRRR